MIAAERVSLVRRILGSAAWTLLGVSVAGAVMVGSPGTAGNQPVGVSADLPAAAEVDEGRAAQAAEPQQDRFPHPAHLRLFPLCGGCHAAAAYDDPAGLYPPASLCANCHDGALLPRVDWRPPANVTAAFDHAAHGRATSAAGQSFECTDCHPAPGAAQRPAPALSAGTTCAGCHTTHRADANCLLCHAPARVRHDRMAHATCDGCHKTVRIDSLPHTRNGCLVCHEELKAHAAPRNCVDCHAI